MQKMPFLCHKMAKRKTFLELGQGFIGTIGPPLLGCGVLLQKMGNRKTFFGVGMGPMRTTGPPLLGYWVGNLGLVPPP